MHHYCFAVRVKRQMDHASKRSLLVFKDNWARSGQCQRVGAKISSCGRRQFFFSGAYSRGGTPYSGLYGEAPPKRGAFFKLIVNKSVGKTAILVYERVIKSVAKWKKWCQWLRNWIRTTENAGKTWGLQEILLFWLILEVYERGAVLL